MVKRTLLSLLVVVASSVAAQETQYTKLLLPIMPGTVNGANGAFWVTELTLANGAFDPVALYCFSGQPCMTVEARSVERTEVPPISDLVPGLIYVPADHARHLTVALRSRNSTPGSDERDFVSPIPVVPDTDFRSSMIELTSIPVEANYRHMLRIYDANANEGAEVRVRVFGMKDGQIASDALIDEKLMLHTPRGSASPYARPDQPSWASLANFSDQPRVRDYSEVHIRIEADTPGMALWAMATATSNKTQRFAVYRP